MTKSIKKYGFLNTMRLNVSILLLLLAIFTIGFNTYTKITEAKQHAQHMRSHYIKEQRQLIKFEVDRVVTLIDYEMDRHLNKAQNIVKARVLKAYSIANDIYEQNKNTKSEKEIKQIIIDTLGPIRFDNGSGYYFIINFKGAHQLNVETAKLTATNGQNISASRVEQIFQNMIKTVRLHHEGFSSYYWSRPGVQGNDYEKVSYVKQFEPYDWIIGSGTYLSAATQSMQNIISHYVTTNRFGPKGRGYVFINELLDIRGGKEFAKVYANPNRPNDTGKFISDAFQDAKGKMFRKEFLQGLRDKGECFVDYWYRKIDNAAPSPKTSFFKLAGGDRFIVAAGLYTDDIEGEIQQILTDLKKQLMLGFLSVVTLFIAGFLLSIFIFNQMGKRLEKDFLLFVDFFKRAALSSERINKDNLKFKELDQLANFANQMLDDKIKIEQELDQEKERLLVTLHSITEGVIATDTEGRVLLLNKVAEQLTGWQQNEVHDKNIKEVLNLHRSGMESATTSTSMATEEVGKQDITLTSRLGKVYRISLNSAPLYIEDKKEIGRVVVFRDETENLKIEAELFKAQKLESVGILAGGIAHDFNNILSGIFGNIELANLKLNRDEHIRPHLQIALDSVQRAKSLTTQLLTFSKGGEPMTEELDLKKMLEEEVPFNLSGSSVKAQYKIFDPLWKVQADPGQISQVISNLVINAEHALPRGGKIVITAKNISARNSKLNKDCVELKVSDNGIGIEPKILSKIFDPYFTTKQNGTGLGLSMVYSIIERHKGVITVDSKPGSGTTFSLLLLADRQTDQSPKLPQAMLAEAEPKKGFKILLIEDDVIIQQVMTGILEASSYVVDVADEGKTGVSMYREAIQNDTPYQLVISDLTIPGGMGGKEAVQKILIINSEAKVIATSGYAMDPIMARFADYGFKGRIVKPFRLEDVHQEIRRVYNQP
ncbi:MAG: hypothetical protein COA36_05340 [Desulfotalea sp.]|nr:MAG: hypothetical protein COA36_05340 [Desulfotalea sp.]